MADDVLVSRPRWEVTFRADDATRPLADRHYNRQSIGAPNFVPPGRCLVLRAWTPESDVGAFWTTSYPLAEYVKHAWAGAWINSAFRNERPDLWLSSDLIREAVAATCARWQPPDLGMVTFIDPAHVRHKRDLGRCYRKAGFKPVGHTQSGLLALQLLPDEMPAAAEPLGSTYRMPFCDV